MPTPRSASSTIAPSQSDHADAAHRSSTIDSLGSDHSDAAHRSSIIAPSGSVEVLAERCAASAWSDDEGAMVEVWHVGVPQLDYPRCTLRYTVHVSEKGLKSVHLVGLDFTYDRAKTGLDAYIVAGWETLLCMRVDLNLAHFLYLFFKRGIHVHGIVVVVAAALQYLKGILQRHSVS
ncbi:hypothetical protein HDU87_005241 [Geranomyces variabilis]|uniref:Uncharacterized protein n=1 Tax=Geranomyces variabilis TaxID=109894 RepID=A0AAD5THF4_9FUNG|nr:hypothetical protein HDU87_005241 [Geranomyces variabilis]